jgi:hypothetical protein
MPDAGCQGYQYFVDREKRIVIQGERAIKAGTIKSPTVKGRLTKYHLANNPHIAMNMQLI